MHAGPGGRGFSASRRGPGVTETQRMDTADDDEPTDDEGSMDAR